MKKHKTSKFEVDFFLLEILTEACWHAGTIVRSMFLDELVDVHYHKMNEYQKASFWTFLERLGKQPTDNFSYETRQRVLCRFSPDMQFEVTTDYKAEYKTNKCFLMNGKYWISKTQFVAPEFIIEVKQISASM